MHLKNIVYIPLEIWKIINDFLGNNYWFYRKKLSLLSEAIDFANSNYMMNSYWKWNIWRIKNDKIYNLVKPHLPYRFINIHKNPYIESTDPPKLSNLYTKNIHYFHKKYREKIFNY